MLKLVRELEKTECSKFKDIAEDIGIPISSVSKVECDLHDTYYLVPSRGFRTSKVESLLPEIGMFLRAKETPVGSISMSEGCYKITVRKAYPECPDMIGMIKKSCKSMGVPTCIGVDYYGEDVSFDLSRIPNMIVAGATGSGKSVVLNNIILSGIASGSRMFLVDPKYVEFSSYKGIKGVGVCHTIEDTKMVLEIIMSSIKHRFRRLSHAKCRNVAEYNSKFADKIKNIVIVIDEWADLVMTDRSVEKLLCSVAQIGRAAGVSIVLATQRPSSDIISGPIKANFPGRIAMRVSSLTDSRVILDRGGAENINILGGGIFISPSSEPISFVSGYVKNIEKAIQEVI